MRRAMQRAQREFASKSPPRLRPEQLALTLSLFAVLMAFATFYALTQPNPAYFRANAYGWGSALLAAPALFILIVRIGRAHLDHSWRLFWTAGWLMLAAHGWASLGLSHLWRPDLVAAEFGFWGALAFWGVEIVWLIDLFAAWTRLDWARTGSIYAGWQVFAAAVVFLGHLAALLTVGGALALAVAIVLIAAVTIGSLIRLHLWEQGR